MNKFWLLMSDQDAARTTGSLLESCCPHSLLRKFDVGILAFVKSPDCVPISYALGKHTFTSDDLFEIGSLTKLFTAALSLRLEQHGLLSLHDPITKFLPEIQASTKITILDLITHHSGLPRVPASLPVHSDDPYALSARSHLTDYAKNFSFKPYRTEGFLYSNLGYAILGLILERAGAADYGNLIQQYIAIPLALTKTRLVPPRQENYGARGFTACGSRARPWTWNAFAPCGGLLSSGSDLSLFINAVMHESTFQPCLISQAKAGRGNIGLGWLLREHTGIAWHNGRTAGFSSYVSVNKDTGAFLVLLTNRSIPKIEAVGMRFEAVMADPGTRLSRPSSRVFEACIFQVVQNTMVLPFWFRSVLIVLITWLLSIAIHFGKSLFYASLQVH